MNITGYNEKVLSETEEAFVPGLDEVLTEMEDIFVESIGSVGEVLALTDDYIAIAEGEDKLELIFSAIDKLIGRKGIASGIYSAYCMIKYVIRAVSPCSFLDYVRIILKVLFRILLSFLRGQKGERQRAAE